MRPQSRDDLATAAEYICVHLHPQELRTGYGGYVMNVRTRYAWGDVPWDGLILLALQALDIGLTALFIHLLGSSLYDKFKKPDPNIERLLKGQRSTLARLDEILSKPDARDVELARVNEQFRETRILLNQRTRARQQFHESMILKIQDSDPEIAAMVDDALRQLEARGAKALVDDVQAAGGNFPGPRNEEGLPMRWWLNFERVHGLPPHDDAELMAYIEKSIAELTSRDL